MLIAIRIIGVIAQIAVIVLACVGALVVAAIIEEWIKKRRAAKRKVRP